MRFSYRRKLARPFPFSIRPQSPPLRPAGSAIPSAAVAVRAQYLQASQSQSIRNSSRTATNPVPIRTPLKLPLCRWRKKRPRSDSMAASSLTPPLKMGTRKFSCVIPARARQLVASRKLLCFPSRTTAHKATQTATLPQRAPMDASFPSAPPQRTFLPILQLAGRFFCATLAPAPRLNARRKQLSFPSTMPARFPETTIFFPPSALPAASSLSCP